MGDKKTWYTDESGQRVEKSDSIRAFIVKDGQVLLVPNEHTGELSIPGGTPEEGETHIESLKREYAEEVGDDPQNLIVEARPFYEKDSIFKSPTVDKIMHKIKIYYACTLQGDPSADLNVTWVPIDEVSTILTRDYQREMIAEYQKITQ